MAETPPTPPPAESEELTPAEEKKFSKFLGKFLADDAPTQPPATPPSPPAPSGGGSIGDQINAALDKRDKDKGQNETITSLRKDVDDLKGQVRKPRHWWFRPFSPLSGE